MRPPVMRTPGDPSPRLSRDRAAAWLARVGPWAVLATALFALYSYGTTWNPPGFYLDEASIAYNAYSVSLDGRDEHGVAWPLFFQTWDASAAINPVYVYGLAGVFKVFGPGILAARLFSAAVGFAAAVVLGLVVLRATRNRTAAVFIAAAALGTPWLFELSRLVFEVALFPLVLVSLLGMLLRVHARPTWSWLEIAAIGGLLALVAYTYTIGRLLGPILALGLVLFASRTRARSILATWIVFGIALLPALVFNVASGGALGARADLVGYIRPGMGVVDIAAAFVDHVVRNVDPRAMLLVGDPNIRHHVPATGSFLIGPFVLALVGVVAVARGRWRDRWAAYLVAALAASFVPASLTGDVMHTLRLVGVPIFLLLLAGFGAARLATGAEPWRRAAVVAVVAVTAAQAALFQVGFWQAGPNRGAAFDADAPRILAAAVATGERPIYLRDRGDLPGYIEAYWYGALLGLGRDAFVRLRSDEVPPAGGIVVGTDPTCGRCEVLAEGGGYRAYRAGRDTAPGLIPNGDFEAIGTTRLGELGQPIFGWSSGADAGLEAGGATTPGAHLVLRHEKDPATAKSASSTSVAVPGGSTLELRASVRAAGSNPHVRVTVALVQSDADRKFVTWTTRTMSLAPSPEWELVEIPDVRLDPRARFVNVACFLEPGVAGDTAELDDVVVDYGG